MIEIADYKDTSDGQEGCNCVPSNFVTHLILLLKIGNKSIIEIIIERCLQCINKKYLIVATSKEKINNKLVDILKRKIDDIKERTANFE